MSPDWHAAVGGEGTGVEGTEEGVGGAGAGEGVRSGARAGVRSGARGGEGAGAAEDTVTGNLATTSPAVSPSCRSPRSQRATEQWLEEEEEERSRIAVARKASPAIRHLVSRLMRPIYLA